MRQLGGTCFNPELQNILEDASKELPAVDKEVNIDAPLGREGNDKLQGFLVNAMMHLFGDYTFFAKESMVFQYSKILKSENLMSKSTENTNSIRPDIKNMHILDALNFLNDDKNIVQQEMRSELLREIVIFLEKICHETTTRRGTILRLG